MELFDETIYKIEQVQEENRELKQENIKLEKEIGTVKEFINKTFECIHILFDFPIERVKSIVKNFYKSKYSAG